MSQEKPFWELEPKRRSHCKLLPEFLAVFTRESLVHKFISPMS